MKVWDVDSEQEEHSLSLSQHSSPSQSDQEQTLGQKANASVMDSRQRLVFKQINQIPTNCQHDNGSSNRRAMKDIPQGSPQNLHFLVHQPKQEQCLHGHEDRKGSHHLVNTLISNFGIPLCSCGFYYFSFFLFIVTHCFHHEF